ncbi:MAG: hypothetical protein HQM06_18055 [Magnetococcales bacterium]|nr:hypothetical protein [Magnetococcales bacterium]
MAQEIVVILEEVTIEANLNTVAIEVEVAGAGPRGEPGLKGEPGEQGTSWPFGANPLRVEGVAKGVATLIDQVAMPSQYRVVQWLLLLADDSRGLAVSSTVQGMHRGGGVDFTEYAILGDSGSIPYELEMVVDGDTVKLMVTSSYDGTLTLRATKVGIFH